MSLPNRRAAALLATGAALTALLASGCSAFGAAAVTTTVTETVTETSRTTETSVSTRVSTTSTTVEATVTAVTTEISEATVTLTPIMDIPGPTTGTACPGSPEYSNEAADGLDAGVAAAWAQAVALANDDGITLCLHDGKRSRTQQQEIYDDYVRQYGRPTADELVLPPDLSSHVTGFALDVQPPAAHQWLQATGGALGFCRIYDNEPWHFEFRAAYQVTGCPDRLPEPVR